MVPSRAPDSPIVAFNASRCSVTPALRRQGCGATAKPSSSSTPSSTPTAMSGGSGAQLSSLADGASPPSLTTRCWILVLATVLATTRSPAAASESNSFISIGPSSLWTQWGEWSSHCVQGSFCGRSVRNRRRHCHLPESQEPGQCEGAPIDYEICQYSRLCRLSTVARQCRDHDNGGVKYFPPSSDEYSQCGSLECRELDSEANETTEGMFVRWQEERVPDGVPCDEGHQCLGGECSTIACAFNTSTLQRGCMGEPNDTLCFTSCGTTLPVSRESSQTNPVLTVPECATNITVRMTNSLVISLSIRLEDDTTLAPTDFESQEHALTVDGVRFVFRKSNQSVAAALDVAYFDVLEVEGPLNQNFSVFDEQADMGPLEFHYTMGPACGNDVETRVLIIASQRDWFSPRFTSSLSERGNFNDDNSRRSPELDEQEQHIQGQHRVNVDPDEAVFVGQIPIQDQQLKWIIFPFSHCSRSCGGGTRRAAIMCANADNHIFRKIKCSKFGPKPKDIVQPCNQIKCPARWEKTKWECSNSCRINGTSTMDRVATCRRVLENGVDALVDQKLCSESVPQTMMSCNATLCTPLWKIAGKWSKCNSTCGAGSKNRDVWCQVGGTKVDKSQCARLRSKPKTVKNCFRRDCVRWQGAGWSECNNPCKNGYRFRELMCVNIGQPRMRSLRQCRHLPEPPTIEKCGISYGDCPIIYKWFTASWGKCSAVCGTTGIQTRQLFCNEYRPSGLLGSLERYSPSSPVFCYHNNSAGTPPETVRPCNDITCLGKWVKGKWGQCSQTCGTGRTYRPVTCKIFDANRELVRTEDSHCNTAQGRHKPRTVQACDTGPCSSDAATVNPDVPHCMGDAEGFESVCEYARSNQICHVDYFHRNCCFTCHPDA